MMDSDSNQNNWRPRRTEKADSPAVLAWKKQLMADQLSSEQQRIEKERPGWFIKHLLVLGQRGEDACLEEIKSLATMNLNEVNGLLGGEVRDLPYEMLCTMFIEGTADEQIASTLRAKREDYLKRHPNLRSSDPDAGRGVIAYDGRFISWKDWESATDSEKRAIMVGSTCFHYNSDTPGMSSSPNDRW